jgi:hypothetical protein
MRRKVKKNRSVFPKAHMQVVLPDDIASEAFDLMRQAGLNRNTFLIAAVRHFLPILRDGSNLLLEPGGGQTFGPPTVPFGSPIPPPVKIPVAGRASEGPTHILRGGDRVRYITEGSTFNAIVYRVDPPGESHADTVPICIGRGTNARILRVAIRDLAYIPKRVKGTPQTPATGEEDTP